jgi:hypothetical protein
MKRVSFPILAALLLAAGCAEIRRPQSAPGAESPGVPVRGAGRGSAGGAEAGGEPGAPPVGMPDTITIPACYRLVLLDGHLALVRETDAQAISPGPASLRIITGEIARGELAYQPGLLPQELAAEVASNRESADRMDNALAAVMERSRELSEQAAQLQAQGKKLAELIAEAQARAAEPQAAAPSAPAEAAQGQPDPNALQNPSPGP